MSWESMSNNYEHGYLNMEFQLGMSYIDRVSKHIN